MTEKEVIETFFEAPDIFGNRYCRFKSRYLPYRVHRKQGLQIKRESKYEFAFWENVVWAVFNRDLKKAKKEEAQYQTMLEKEDDPEKLDWNNFKD